MKQSGSRHHLLAILAADVSGYTRLMANDDRATVMALDAARTVFREHVESNAGRVVDMVGDAGLAVFEAASEALHAATAIQSKLASLGHALPEERRMRLRIGIHLGEVVERSDGSVYGDGVNIAARLEALAEPGGIAVSHAVREAIGNRFDNTFDDIGARSLKNVADPVRVFVRRADNRYRFGTCELHALERRLLVDGKPVEIGVLAFDVLLVLIEQGRIVSKNELLECLGERNAAARIRTLRKLLSPETIETIPGRGYRFVARLDDARLHPPAALAILAASQPPGLKTNLPDKLPPLIGRDDDLVELRALTAKHSLVTIVGAGGVGKTRLAQALLHGQRNTYPHGVCFVELASVTDPAALPGAIAAALGVHIGTGDPLAGLVAAVAPLTVLVALDNAEHLLAEVARVADALHRGAPLATLIVTSQAPLKVSGEQLCRLSALALPDKEITAAEAHEYGALALFVARARELDPRFDLTNKNVARVVALCRAVDGLALAIELAAARLPLLGLSQLAASLPERLRLLTGGTRGAPARQQTLRAALDWSHSLLGAAEQIVFRRLAVIAGSASLDLVQQIAADTDAGGDIDAWTVLEALGALIDRSLVAVTTGELPRYRLLDSPRAFALECLTAAGELELVRQRHAKAVAARFDAAWDERWSGLVGAEDWRASLEPDFENAREAFAWAKARGDATTALAIGATLLRALPRSPLADRVALAEASAALVDPSVPPRLQLRVWLAQDRAWIDTQAQRGRLSSQQALSLARESNDRFGLYFALSRCAVTAARLHEAAGAEAALNEMREVQDPTWPPQRLLLGNEAEYFCATYFGVPTTALGLARRQLDLTRAAGANASITLANLIDSELAAGEPNAAVSTGLALVAQLQGTRDEYGMISARLNLTSAFLVLGDTVQARATAQVGWPRAPLFDMQPYWANYLALLAALEHRPRTAARLAGYAEASYTRKQEQRDPLEAQAFRRAVELSRTALGDTEFERLLVDGNGMREEDVSSLAFALSDS